jgi:orotate phosphoribosyltransferase/DNA integrity scanning protein DisA with diadenylate cyclase activity
MPNTRGHRKGKSKMKNNNLLEVLKRSRYYITDSHFQLVSGKHSDTYVHVRLLLMDPKMCKLFCDSAIQILKPTSANAVAGFTMGGILLAEAISKRLGIHLIVGRRGQKGIEWIDEKKLLRSDTKIILVDDILTTENPLDEAISSLADTKLGKIVGIVVAVDRSIKTPEFQFRTERIPFNYCERLELTLYDPGDLCPFCRIGIPPIDFSNPEENFMSVLLSQPPEESKFIFNGYKRIYQLQKADENIRVMKACMPWLNILFLGLPVARMREDTRLIHFINHLATVAEECGIAPRVLSEVVGQMVSLSSIRVESRAIGCSLIIGNDDTIKRYLQSPTGIKNLPRQVSYRNFTNLVPHFDALLETKHVLLLDREGNVKDFRILISNQHKKDGLELLKFVTERTPSIGFVLRRGRSAISVYRGGKLDVIGELSERTGVWEFSMPLERVEQIENDLPGIGDLLMTIIEVARELVAKRYGALFIVGDASNLQRKPPKIEIEPQPITDMSIADIVELSKLDGASIIDQHGRLIQTTVIIQNKTRESHIIDSETMHGGSRRETARRTSIECPDCVAIYVSQNGVIEVYVRGRKCLITASISGLRSEDLIRWAI